MTLPWYDSGLSAVYEKIVQACDALMAAHGVDQEVMQTGLNGQEFPAAVKTVEWTSEDSWFELAQFTGESALLLGSQYALWVKQRLPEGELVYCDIFSTQVSETGERSISHSRSVFEDPRPESQEWETSEDGVQFRISSETTDEIVWKYELILGWLNDALETLNGKS